MTATMPSMSSGVNAIHSSFDIAPLAGDAVRSPIGSVYLS